MSDYQKNYGEQVNLLSMSAAMPPATDVADISMRLNILESEIARDRLNIAADVEDLCARLNTLESQNLNERFIILENQDKQKQLSPQIGDKLSPGGQSEFEGQSYGGELSPGGDFERQSSSGSYARPKIREANELLKLLDANVDKNNLRKELSTQMDAGLRALDVVAFTRELQVFQLESEALQCRVLHELLDRLQDVEKRADEVMASQLETASLHSQKSQEDNGFSGKLAEDVAALASRLCIIECQRTTAELKHISNQVEVRGSLAGDGSDFPTKIPSELLERLTMAEDSLSSIQAGIGNIVDVVNDGKELCARMSDLCTRTQEIESKFANLHDPLLVRVCELELEAGDRRAEPSPSPRESSYKGQVLQAVAQNPSDAQQQVSISHLPQVDYEIAAQDLNYAVRSPQVPGAPQVDWQVILVAQNPSEAQQNSQVPQVELATPRDQSLHLGAVKPRTLSDVPRTSHLDLPRAASAPRTPRVPSALVVGSAHIQANRVPMSLAAHASLRAPTSQGSSLITTAASATTPQMTPISGTRNTSLGGLPRTNAFIGTKVVVNRPNVQGPAIDGFARPGIPLLSYAPRTR
jgi:hypothetical protein